MTRIFLSYRRGEHMYLADQLAESLRSAFGGESVFLDASSIPPGADFPTFIRREIERSQIVLFLIGREWESRLHNADDWVRTEILEARQLGKNLIPVVVAGRPMPLPEAVPDELRFICRLQALEIASSPRHLDDIKRITLQLRHHHPRSATSERPTAAAPTVPVPTATMTPELSAAPDVPARRMATMVGLTLVITGLLVFAVARLAGDRGSTVESMVESTLAPTTTATSDPSAATTDLLPIRTTAAQAEPINVTAVETDCEGQGRPESVCLRGVGLDLGKIYVTYQTFGFVSGSASEGLHLHAYLDSLEMQDDLSSSGGFGNGASDEFTTTDLGRKDTAWSTADADSANASKICLIVAKAHSHAIIPDTASCKAIP